MSGSTDNFEISLGYSHGAGALRTYFDALAAGRAMARKCPACGRVWFPPHATCPEDGADCEWLELDGGGVVVGATHTHSRLPLADAGADHLFVLVAMDGADNAAFGRFSGIEPGDLVGRRVRLANAANARLPAQRLVFQLVGAA
jgi:uncharacterized OB-fold protein